MKRSPPPVRYLVLWLTTACNLRCTYCYRGDQPTRVLPLEVARAALELASASGLPFHVQLAGGEPTLEPGLMEAVARMVRGSNRPATLAVQTNGTLIDAHLVDLWRRFDIGVGVSVDGPPAVHERTRGNAGATFRGLALLQCAGIPVRVTTVLTGFNVLELGRLVLSMASFANVRGIGLDPVVLRGRAAGRENLVPSEVQVRTGIDILLPVLRDVNRYRRVPLRLRELDSVSRALKGGAGPRAYCHACVGEALAVHPDGTVYPCGQWAGDPGQAVGTVQGIEWGMLGRTFTDARLQGPCGECPLDGRCPGDCPSRLAANGMFRPRAMCAIYRTIADHLTRDAPAG